MRSFASIAAICLVLVPFPAWAQQETGIAKMHATAKIGGKLCMTSHEHYGESPPVASARAGRTLAVKKWEIFTAEEYGRVWGSYAASAGKKEKCVGAAPNMICSVESRPCRSGR